MIIPSQEFWNIFKPTNGALSCTEAIAIYQSATLAPTNGIFAEFGVFHGKSAMAAIHGGIAKQFHLVEPEFDKTIPTTDVANRIAMVTKEKVDLFLMPIGSIEYLTNSDWPFSYVFVDSGDHQELPMQEVKLLEDRMVKGGIIGFHDYNCQFIQVNEAYNYLLSTGKYEEVKFDWDSIIKYADENNIEEGNCSWHHPELKHPNFVGALMRK